MSTEKACVVYELDQGTIVHRHFVIVLPGARELSDEEVAGRALEEYEHTGHYQEDIKVGTLVVPVQELRESVAYRVDPQDRRLVEVASRPLRVRRR
jgi:hypothetical protein